MSTTVERQKLAIDGGTPVRTEPLPAEWSGSHWIDRRELELVSQVIEARSPYRYYGLDHQHMVERFEQAFAAQVGRKHALGTASGTAALSVALAALGVGPGDEVLMPGYLWVACISAVVRLGAIPRIVDIDDTFAMDPEDLHRKIGPHSKAVMIVHMSGTPGRMQEVAKVARDAGLPLVEDCAQANGASQHGTKVGTLGDLAIFSIQVNKTITAGEGGVIVCDDDDLHMRCFAAHDVGYAPGKNAIHEPSDERYQTWGIGARLNELSAAMGLGQLEKLPLIAGAMRKAKWAIRRQIESLPGLGFRRVIDPDGDAGSFMITIYETPEMADRFTEALQAEGLRGPKHSSICVTMKNWGLHWSFNNLSLVHRRSISADGWPWTHPANAFAADYDYGPGTLPVCDDMTARGALLAIPSCLTERDVADIIAAFTKVAGALR